MRLGCKGSAGFYPRKCLPSIQCGTVAERLSCQLASLQARVRTRAAANASTLDILHFAPAVRVRTPRAPTAGLGSNPAGGFESWLGFEPRGPRKLDRVRKLANAGPGATAKVPKRPGVRAVKWAPFGRQNRFLRGRNCFGLVEARRTFSWQAGGLCRAGTVLFPPRVAKGVLPA